jgi:hypothetical protein
LIDYQSDENYPDQVDIPGKGISHPIYNSKKDCITPEFPFEWKPREYRVLINNIIKAPSVEKVVIPPLKQKGLNTEIEKFRQCLVWYEKSIPDKYMSTKEIFLRTLREGPQFTEELSDTLKYSIRRTIAENWEDFLEYPVLIGSIDYIFDPKCLPRWLLPDGEDYLYYFKERKEIKPHYLSMILDELMSVLPTELDRPDKLDLLKYLKKSSVMTGSNGETTSNYILHSKTRSLDTTTKLKFKRCLVWKSADENRDCLIGDGPTLHTMTEASFLLKQIIKPLKECKAFGFNSYHGLQNLKNKKLTYLMVDIKKCGLTIPRNLILPILKRLSEVYPGSIFSKLWTGYATNPELLVKGEWIHMTEGLGLGMLNELVTLIMILIFRVAKKQDFLPPDSDGWFMTDDQVVFFKERNLSLSKEEYLERYISFLTSMGITVHEKKPVISKCGIFLENYSEYPLFEKNLRRYWILLNFFDSHNICDAKARFSNSYLRAWGLSQDDNDYALDLAISFWGHEFHRDEVYLPYNYGGWIRFREDRLDPSLKLASEGKIPLKYKRIWFNYVEPNTMSRGKLSGISKRFKELWIESDNSLEGRMTFKEVINQITLSLNRNLGKGNQQYIIKKYWKEVKDNRWKAFTSKRCKPMVEFVNSRVFNNYQIPDEVILKGHSPRDYCKFFPKLDVEKCSDPLRLLLITQKESDIRAPKEHNISGLLGQFMKHPSKLVNGDVIHTSFMLANFFKLKRFGNNLEAIIYDLETRFPMLDISFISNDDDIFDSIKNLIIGERTETSVILPLEGFLFWIDYRQLLGRENFFSGEDARDYYIKLILSIKDEQATNGWSLDDLWDWYLRDLKSNYELLFKIGNSPLYADVEIQVEETFIEPMEQDEPYQVDIDELNEYINYQIQGYLSQAHLVAGPEERHRPDMALTNYLLGEIDYPTSDEEPYGILGSDDSDSD